MKEFDRIYTKVINYAMQHGHKPTKLYISMDRYLTYSYEIRSKIKNIGLDVIGEIKPNILKVGE